MCGDFLFASVADAPFWPAQVLVDRLVRGGAPKDFTPHALRHTCASWFEDQGASLYERALVLNHAQGGVTTDTRTASPRT